jgi:hypothetical protein
MLMLGVGSYLMTLLPARQVSKAGQGQVTRCQEDVKKTEEGRTLSFRNTSFKEQEFKEQEFKEQEFKEQDLRNKT